MPAVEVSKEQSVAKREPTALSRFEDFFTPIFPADRFSGVRPLARMRALTDELDRVFSGDAASVKENFWAPAIEVRRCNGDLVVTAEVPGLQKNDVKVEIVGDALVIEGERKSEHKEDHAGYHRSERSYGCFYRSIPLPEGARADEVKAELADGVLKVSIPAPEAKKQVHEVTVETPAKG